MQTGMTASTATSLAVPPTQNTAPVLEFNCLYTHDIRRKSKRWQDGVAKFHTFNKRVMVYDATRHFVGDSHWRESSLLADGDEITLEKGGVMVQIADQIGQTVTDLSELIKSKPKTAGHRSSPSVALSGKPYLPSGRTPTTIDRNQAASARVALQTKHRSLNALLGSNHTQLGKASLPVKSPFELRQEELENVALDHSRSPKRRKVDKTVKRPQNPAREQPQPVHAKRIDSSDRYANLFDGISLISDDDTRPHDRRNSPARKAAPAQKATARKDNAVNRSNSVNTEPPSKRLITKTVTKKKTLACQEEANMSISAKTMTERQKLAEHLAKAQASRGARISRRSSFSDDIEHEMDPPAKRIKIDPPPVVPVRRSSPRKSSADNRPEKRQADEVDVQEAAPLTNEGRILIDLVSSVTAPKESDADDPLSKPPDAMPYEIPVPQFTPITNTTPIDNIDEQLEDEFGVLQTDDANLLALESRRITKPAKPAPRKIRRKGISSKTIRESAAACFQKSPVADGAQPADGDTTTAEGAKQSDVGRRDTAPQTLSDDGSAQRVLEDEEIHPSEIDRALNAGGPEEDTAKDLVPVKEDTSVRGPWSREAFDLFKYRPPAWDENKWCVKKH